MPDQTELNESSNRKRQTVTDPVCGMTVDPESAAGSFDYKGQAYYFCSLHCLEKFREDPEGFLNRPGQPVMVQPVGIRRERAQHFSSHQAATAPDSDKSEPVATAPGSDKTSFFILQDRHRAVPSRRAHDAAARMRR